MQGCIRNEGEEFGRGVKNGVNRKPRALISRLLWAERVVIPVALREGAAKTQHSPRPRRAEGGMGGCLIL